MNHRLTTMIISLLSFAGVAQAQENLPLNPFGNPLLPEMVGDPSIIDVDGTFYCYVTTDGYGRGLETSGPPVVWKSPDFVNWSFSGTYCHWTRDLQGTSWTMDVIIPEGTDAKVILPDGNIAEVGPGTHHFED